MFFSFRTANLESTPCGAISKFEVRDNGGVVIRRRDSDGPYGAVAHVSRRSQYEDQMAIGTSAARQRWGGHRQGSNQDIAMSSQQAVVEKGGFLDLL